MLQKCIEGFSMFEFTLNKYIMKYLPFNLNDYIKVKIKEKGYIHIQKKYTELIRYYPNIKPISIDYYVSRADKEGYTEMQMHDFIDKFGDLGLSLPECVDISILISQAEN
jgi:hypothetical protein